MSHKTIKRKSSRARKNSQDRVTLWSAWRSPAICKVNRTANSPSTATSPDERLKSAAGKSVDSMGED